MKSLPFETSRLLRRAEGRVRALGAPASAMPGRERIAGALARADRRLREGVDAPLRVAFFGPTGAGKSKLFNTLAGGEVSPAGFRRPCTMAAVHLVHDDRRELAESLGLRWRSHRRDEWRDLVLIDTPDFDSVERANREEAERVLLDADAFIFVTDVHKYGDRSTWEYIERILATARPLVVVLNKAGPETAARDFFARLDEHLQVHPVATGSDSAAADRIARRILIAEHAVDDHAPLPEDDSGVVELNAATDELVVTAGEVRERLVRGLRRELDAAVEPWAAAADALTSWLAGVDALRQRVRDQFASSSAALARELRTEVDAGVKAEVFAKVLAGIEKIDILRYPRQLLALPWRGVQTLYRRWFPQGSAEEGGGGGGEKTLATNVTFQLTERCVLDFVDSLQDAFRAEERCREASAPQRLESVGVQHAELQSRFEVCEEQFRDWLRSEVEDTAGQVTGEHKLKFIVAQLLYNGVVVGVQINTGGGLMMTEVVTDAVLSPLVAKAVGMAVSSEQVARFEERARTEHHRALAALLEEVRNRALAQLDELDAWRCDLDELTRDMSALSGQVDDVCSAFAAGETVGDAPEGTEERGGAADRAITEEDT